jgi:hypothetical protein
MEQLSSVFGGMKAASQWRVLKQLQQVASTLSTSEQGDGDIAKVTVSSPEVLAGEDIDELYHAFRHAVRKSDNTWKHDFLGEAELKELKWDVDQKGISTWLDEKIDADVTEAIAHSPRPPKSGTIARTSSKRKSENLVLQDAAAAFRHVTEVVQPRRSNAIAEAAGRECPHCHRLSALKETSSTAAAAPTVPVPFADVSLENLRYIFPKELLPQIDLVNTAMWREVADVFKRCGPVVDLHDGTRGEELERSFKTLLHSETEIRVALEKLSSQHASVLRGLESRHHKDRKLLEQARLELRADEQDLAELEKELGLHVKDNIQTLFEMQNSLAQLENEIYSIQSSIVDAELQRKLVKKELAKVQWTTHGVTLAKNALVALLESNNVGAAYIDAASASSSEPLPGIAVRYCDDILSAVQVLEELYTRLERDPAETLASNNPVTLRCKQLVDRVFGPVCPECGHLVGSSRYCPLTGRQHELPLTAAEGREEQNLFSLACAPVNREQPLLIEMEDVNTTQSIRRRSTARSDKALRRALSLKFLYDEESSGMANDISSPTSSRKKSALLDGELAQSVFCSSVSQLAVEESDDSEQEYAGFGRPATPKASQAISSVLGAPGKEKPAAQEEALGPSVDHLKLANAAALNLTQIFVRELRSAMSGAPLRDHTVAEHYKKSLLCVRKGQLNKKTRYKLSIVSPTTEVAELEEEVCEKLGEILSEFVASMPSFRRAAERPAEAKGDVHADPSAIATGATKLPMISKAQAAQGNVSPKDFAMLFFQEEILKGEAEKLVSMKAVAHVPIKTLLAQAVELERLNEELTVTFKIAQELLIRDGGEAV